MDYVAIEIDEIIAATDKAVLCDIDGEEIWIPRSVIDGGDSLDIGDNGEIEVAEWFAKKEGFDY